MVSTHEGAMAVVQRKHGEREADRSHGSCEGRRKGSYGEKL